MVTQLCQRDIEANGLKIRIQATTDRREALKDARYVFVVVRIGGLKASCYFGCAVVCNVSISVQRLAVEAADGGEVMIWIFGEPMYRVFRLHDTLVLSFYDSRTSLREFFQFSDDIVMPEPQCVLW